MKGVLVECSNAITNGGYNVSGSSSDDSSLNGKSNGFDDGNITQNGQTWSLESAEGEKKLFTRAPCYLGHES